MALLINKNNISVDDFLGGVAQLNEVATDKFAAPLINYTHVFYNNTTKYYGFTPSKAGEITNVAIQLLTYGIYVGDNARVYVTIQENINDNWEDRATATFYIDDYINTDTQKNFGAWVISSFDTTVNVDTISDKWRFKYKVVHDGGYSKIYIGSYNNGTAISVIPILSSTKALDVDNDWVVNFSTIEGKISQTYEVKGVDLYPFGFYASTGVRSRKVFYVNGSSKLSEPHPNFTITESLTGNEKFISHSGFVISDSQNKLSASVAVGKEYTPVDFGKKVEFLMHHDDSTFTGAFMNGIYNKQNVGHHFRFSFFGKQRPFDYFRTTLAQAHHIGDTEIVVNGDYSHWEIGDRIQTTGGRYTKTYDNLYYSPSFYNKIVSVSYDSTNNITTIGLEDALNKHYDASYYETYYPNIPWDINTFPYHIYNVDKITTVRFAETDTGYCKSTNYTHKMDMYYMISSSFEPRFTGVLIEDIYRFDFKMRTDRQYWEKETKPYFKDVWITASRDPFKIWYGEDVQVDGGGTLYTHYGNTVYYFHPYKHSNMIIQNTHIYTSNYGIYQEYANNLKIINNYIETHNIVFYNKNTLSKNMVFANNKIAKARYGIYNYYSGEIKIYDNQWGMVTYKSYLGVNAPDQTGVYFFYRELDNSRKISIYRDNIYFANNIINPEYNGTIDIYLENVTAQAYRTLINDGSSKWTTKLKEPSKLRINNFNENGINYTKTWYGLIEDEKLNENEHQWIYSIYNNGFEAKETANTLVVEKDIPIAVSININILNENFYKGVTNYKLPTLKIYGLEIDEPTAVVTAEAKTGWQTLTVIGVPKNTGNINIELTFYTEQEEFSKVISDNWIVSTRPRDTSMRNVLDRGLPFDFIFSENLSALQLFTTTTDYYYGENSFGELVKNTGKVVNNLHDFDPGNDTVVVRENQDKIGYSLTNVDKDDIVQKVWEYANRTLTSFGTLIADVWNYVTRTLTGKVDVGKVNGVGVNSINDFKDKNTEAEIHNYLDSYTNKDYWKGEGMNENTLHQGLDSYNNKDTYKADVANLDVPVSSRSSHTPQDVWNNSSRTLTDKNGFTLTEDDKEDIADKTLNKDINCL